MVPIRSLMTPQASWAAGSRRVGRFVRAAGLFLGLLPAAGALSQPDYNHDCTSNFFDSLAFMSDFAAELPAADLNLDGRVDQTDFDGFADSRAKAQFGYYWQVSTTLEPGRAMDTQTDLTGVPVSRNCTIIYEQEFPKIPIIYQDADRLIAQETGFHLLFRGVLGSYAGWRLNHDAWMAEHLASLAAVVLVKVPSPNFDGLVCLDWETVMPLFRVQNHRPEPIAAWLDMMQQINSPAIDRDFAAFADWSVPEGVASWSDLSDAQREAFAAAAHLKVGLEFFVQTIDGVRALRPRSKLHYYGLPQGIWPFYDPTTSGYNDQLAPLWRAVDVLSPSLYQLYWTTTDPSTSPCPEAVNTPGLNSHFFKGLLDEMYRLKTAYPRPGQQIIPYAWWHYKAQAGSCSPEISPTLLVNDTNLNHQLQLPWWFGADAVAIWGHYRRNGEVTPRTMSTDIQARWRAPMSRLACPR